MALTKVGGDIIKQPLDIGNINATTVQIGTATTIHTTGIDLGSGNLTGHNIHSTGIVTATSFVGPVTGTATTATNLANAANITTGTISNDRLPATITKNLTGNVTGNVTGNINGNLTGNVTGNADTASNLTGSPSITVANIIASGNVSIAGTLTYEDVTNIDSVGVVTTRTGIDVTGGHIDLIDNSKIRVGTGDDLQIYHDGSNSYVKDAGTGELRLEADAGGVRIQRASGHTGIFYNVGGQVELYYDNSKKLETTTTGAKVTGALEVTQEYPSIRPILDLNFAATKTLDRRITFTRDSIGTYVDDMGIVRYASNNVPRFDHNPTTGESLGLLIEESRSNSWTYSQPTSAASFGSSATKTFNAATAPNGKTEAFRITHNGSSGNSNWRATRSITFGANSMVLSVWAKGDGGNNYFTWSFQNLGGAIVRAGFKLEGDGETSIITNGNGGHTLKIEKYPDGWYRCIIIGNTQSSGGTTQFLYTVSSYSESHSVSGGSVLLWGFQLEAGSFATSYIPTSGSTVTRAQDTPLITGTNFTDFYNQSEGTLVLSADIGYLATSNQTAVAFEDTSNVSATFIAMGYNTGGGGSGTAGAWYNSSGTTSAFAAHNIGITINTEFKQAYAYKLNDFSSVANGSTPITDTSGGLTSLIDRVRFGIYHYDGMTSGHIRQFKYYNKRLPNAQLQGLTQQ